MPNKDVLQTPSIISLVIRYFGAVGTRSGASNVTNSTYDCARAVGLLTSNFCTPYSNAIRNAYCQP